MRTIPPGEWDAETVPVAFDAYGMNCLIVRGPLGALCGYVKLPNEHPLYGVDYSRPVPEALKLAAEAVTGGPIGKRGIMDVFLHAFSDGEMHASLLFDVHGGITFAGCPCTEPPQEGFWYGFDCSHAGDLTPGLSSSWRCEDEVYRDLPYVRSEVESLALQLSRLQALVS